MSLIDDKGLETTLNGLGIKLNDLGSKLNDMKKHIYDSRPDYNQNDENASDYIKNRPFYDTRKTVPCDITFDGNLDGKECVDVSTEDDMLYYVKLSDETPSKDDLIGGTISYIIDGSQTRTDTINTDIIEDVDEEGNVYVIRLLVFVNCDVASDGGVTLTNGVWTFYSATENVYTSSLSFSKTIGELKQLDEKYLPYEYLQDKVLVRTGTTGFSGQGAFQLSPAQDNYSLEVGKTYSVYVDGSLCYTAVCELGDMWGDSGTSYRVLRYPGRQITIKIAEQISDNILYAVTDDSLIEPWSESGLPLEIYEVPQIPEEKMHCYSDAIEDADNVEIVTITADSTSSSGYISSKTGREIYHSIVYEHKIVFALLGEGSGYIADSRLFTYTGRFSASQLYFECVYCDDTEINKINLVIYIDSNVVELSRTYALPFGFSGVSVGQIPRITSVTTGGIPSSWEAIDIPVQSVNGQTGEVVLTASDVGALPDTTEIPSIEGLATESYVDSKVAGVVNSAPETLDTLNELAAALGNDENFATTVATQIGEKVDKIEGKGLSTEDYTTDEKTKLASIAEGAEVNVQSDWNETDTTSDAYIANKPEIPSKISDLTNDSGFLTSIPDDYVTETELAAKGYLTSYTETDPTVPDWAKQPTKPIYTADEVGALPVDTVIPSIDGLATEEYVDTAVANAGGTGTNIQSDWSQSDESASDYIKNRPFYDDSTEIQLYSEDCTWGALFDEPEITIPTDGFQDYVCDGNQLKLVIDGEYAYLDWPSAINFFDLTIDDYIVRLARVDDLTGNIIGINITSSNFTDNQVSHVELYSVRPDVHKLDAKFLPDSVILPSSTTDDNDKILMVVDGVPAWVTITNAEGVAY